MKISLTAFELAQRFIGTSEVSGKVANQQIMAMLKLDAHWPQGDEVPWCSGFVNYICWLLRLPRSKSLMARSWLQVGEAIPPYATEIEQPEVGFDVVILKRGGSTEPGPEVVDAPGHVGFFAGFQKPYVMLLGGNQGDQVCTAPYRANLILGVRRLHD